MKNLFLVTGLGRCGTQWVARFFAAQPGVEARHQALQELPIHRPNQLKVNAEELRRVATLLRPRIYVEVDYAWLPHLEALDAHLEDILGGVIVIRRRDKKAHRRSWALKTRDHNIRKRSWRRSVWTRRMVEADGEIGSQEWCRNYVREGNRILSRNLDLKTKVLRVDTEDLDSSADLLLDFVGIPSEGRIKRMRCPGWRDELGPETVAAHYWAGTWL